MNNSSEGRIEPSHSTDSVSKVINSDADLLPQLIEALTERSITAHVFAEHEQNGKTADMQCVLTCEGYLPAHK